MAVRLSVAQNPDAPKDVLKSLSEDGQFNVRFAVAQNPNTPSETLDFLSDDPDEPMRMAVLENPNVSNDTLGKMTQDKTKEIRLRARELLQEREVKSFGFNRLKTQDKPNETEEKTIDPWTIKYARSPNVQHRLNVANDPRSPSILLKELGNDVSPNVRFAVARNFNAPEETLKQLSNDKIKQIGEMAQVTLKKQKNRNLYNQQP